MVERASLDACYSPRARRRSRRGRERPWSRRLGAMQCRPVVVVQPAIVDITSSSNAASWYSRRCSRFDFLFLWPSTSLALPVMAPARCYGRPQQHLASIVGVVAPGDEGTSKVSGSTTLGLQLQVVLGLASGGACALPHAVTMALQSSMASRA
jgi:hypothetical protein